MKSVGVGGSQSRKFIPALHGLRGVMAVWVALYHASPSFLILREGYFAVDVFFMLSGFVLMNAHARDFQTITVSDVIEFLRKRFWRVYPLLFVSVVLGIFAFRFFYDFWPAPKLVIESLLILDQWAAPGLQTTPAAWSLGVEVIGYLAFPLIACGLLRLHARFRIPAITLIVALQTYYVAWIGGGWDHIHGIPAVIRMATEFTIGCALFMLGRSSRHGDLLALMGIFGAALSLAMHQPLIVLPFLALIVYGLACADGPAAQLLALPIFQFLGRISFALYITHQLILRVLHRIQGANESSLTRSAYSLAFIALAFALATFLCFTVEEPLNRWGRRVALTPTARKRPQS